MTKEEIIEDAFDNEGIDMREITTKPHKAILAAMDEYARQEAIAFAQWMLTNEYRPFGVRWLKGGTSYTRSSKEVYDIYQQQKLK